MRISGHPPPYTTRASFTVSLSTHSASCSERSASSKMCVLAPRSTMVHASPSATREKWMSRSSPIITSSMSPQVPSFTPTARRRWT